LFMPTPPSTACRSLSLHDALPIFRFCDGGAGSPSEMMMMCFWRALDCSRPLLPFPSPLRARLSESSKLGMSPSCMFLAAAMALRSEEHTSELQSRENLVCRLLLEK